MYRFLRHRPAFEEDGNTQRSYYGTYSYYSVSAHRDSSSLPLLATTAVANGAGAYCKRDVPPEAAWAHARAPSQGPEANAHWLEVPAQYRSTHAHVTLLLLPLLLPQTRNWVWVWVWVWEGKWDRYGSTIPLACGRRADLPRRRM